MTSDVQVYIIHIYFYSGVSLNKSHNLWFTFKFSYDSISKSLTLLFRSI